MFIYLRYFYAISLILVVIGSVLVGSMIRSMAAENMAILVKEHDQLLAEQYINNVWNRYYPTDKMDPKYYDKLMKFRAESKKFTSALPKLRFSVTTPKGKVIFRSDEKALLNEGGQDINLFRLDKNKEDQAQSRVIEEVTLVNDSGQNTRTVIQSLFPIINENYDRTDPKCSNLTNVRIIPVVCKSTFGVIEMVSDISPQWKDLSQIQTITIASIIGIFLILISILFLTTQRAEAIIAKQHEANMELISAAATAEAENRDKSQFLANISHELRTPLNAIIGFSEIIKNEALGNLNQTHQEYIRDIHGSGKHLLSLINDILDYSKAEAGKLELSLTEIDLTKLLVNSMRLVIPRAEEAQVTLTEDLPKDHIICTTDAKKLKQVILNLLSNAVKFTPAGGEVRLHAFQKLVDGTVHIKVSDSGIGIAPKDIAKVMSPFGQVDSKLSRKYEGTGLGLPLSKKFVEIMGGKFEIESEINVGTTITIILPAKLEEEA